MSDLISRQALCEYALNQKDKSVTPNDIMRFPSAEPGIILCKDCKYHRPSGKCKYFSCDHRNYVRHTDDEDFCSNAERRTDE